MTQPAIAAKQLTKEQLFYHKVKHDRAWFMANFLKIRDKSANIVPFKLNRAQQIFLEQIEADEKAGKPKRYIILKARQMGFSTFTEGLIFHDTTTNANKNSLIIAHEEAASQNLFSMSKLYYDYLPEVLKPMKKYANGKVLQFENPTSDENEKLDNPGLRSKISIATAGAGEVGRSATYHNLHVSELAFFPDAKVTMLGLMQSVPDQPNTLVIWESTANGVGDFFHEQWNKAVRGESDFTPMFFPWFIQPEYSREFRTDSEREQLEFEINVTTKDMEGNEIRTYEYELMHKHGLTLEQMNWRRWTVANKCQGDEELFMQEYPSTPEEAFIASGRPKFNVKVLRKYQTLTKKGTTGYLIEKEGRVQFVQDDKGYVTIWEAPESNTTYSIGADVAEGLVHGDYSCGLVGKDKNLEIVAQWHGHIDPDLFGVELVKLGRFYNNAYLGVENNNHGLTTLNSIKKQEYWNIFFSKVYDRVADKSTQKIGWSTTIRTKPLMIDKLAEYVREMYLGIYSDLLIGEMFTYVIEDDGKTNAQSGCNDDAVMACAILLQLMMENMGEDYVPEIPFDQKGKHGNYADPLFEKEDSAIKLEYAD